MFWMNLDKGGTWVCRCGVLVVGGGRWEDVCPYCKGTRSEGEAGKPVPVTR